MQLVSLDVQSFAGIRRARLRFAPGLNVLHGRNELGKSTLVEAIRAVLLTPSGSTASQDWHSWHDDSPPQVEIVLRSEERRFWRAKKVFGAGGSATLDESSDNESYANLARQRQVDDELRKLLRWGLRAPGGRGGQRGMPQSFLSAILLPGQAEATKVFDLTLKGDDDESARELLKSAFQALAADPQLGAAIVEAQRHVDEAFTPTGRPKKGKGTPLFLVAEKVRDLTQRRNVCQAQCDNSERLRSLLATKSSELSESQAELEALSMRLARARRLEAARSEHQGLLGQSQTIEAKRKATEALSQQLAKREEELQEAQRQHGAAKEAEQAAQRALEAARSEHSPEQRLRMQAEAKRELSEAELRHKELQEKHELARRLADSAQELGDAEQERDSKQLAVADLDNRIERANERLAVLTAQRTLVELGACRDQREALEKEHGRCRESAERLTDLNQRIAAIDEASRTIVAPTAEQLVAFSELERELEIKRGQLNAGLSISIEPAKPLSLEVAADEGAAETHTFRERREFLAKREVVVRHPEFGQLTIRVGDQGGHDALAILVGRWRTEVEPWLERTGCQTLRQLEGLADETRRRQLERQNLESQRRDAQADEQRLPGLTDNIREFQRRETDLEDRWSQIEERLRSDAEQGQRLRPAGKEQVDGEIEVARDRASSLKEQRAAAAEKHRQAEERLKQARGSAEQVRTEAEDKRIGTIEQCNASLAKSDQNLEQLRAKVTSFDDEEPLKVRAATKQLKEAKAEVERAAARVESIDDTLRSSSKEASEAQGALRALEGSFSQAELDKAATELTDARRECESHGDPEELASALQELIESSRSEFSKLEKVVQQTEFELAGSGGASLPEQLEELNEAVQRAEEDERRLIEDYDAWQALRQALEEVERTEASNLGGAMQPALSGLLAELSGGVHSGVSLGVDLELLGIHSGGAPRELSTLSVGMQDQIATLLRVHLAAQLRHFVVLDDQLVQSDPERMDWLRAFLLRHAAECQIVVFTCRPEDYAGLADCHTTDLGAVVERFR